MSRHPPASPPPLAQRAGHDSNYLAISGSLHAIGARDQPPTVPLNLIADYAGGSMFLVSGVLAALYEARPSGQGQVVDAAMVDGAAVLSAMFHGLLAFGAWQDEQANLLDGGCYFYRAYQTKDGESIAVGPLEAKFFQELVAKLGPEAAELTQADRARWPRFNPRGADLGRVTMIALERIDAAIEARLGARALSELRRVLLAGDWGPPVAAAPKDLDAQRKLPRPPLEVVARHGRRAPSRGKSALKLARKNA